MKNVKIGEKINFNVKMTPTDFTKKVLGSAVTYGVGVIVYAVIKSYLPDDMKFHKKIAVALGTWALTGLIKDAAEAYTDKFVDQVFEKADEAREVIRKKLAELDEKVKEDSKKS